MIFRRLARNRRRKRERGREGEKTKCEHKRDKRAFYPRETVNRLWNQRNRDEAVAASSSATTTTTTVTFRSCSETSLPRGGIVARVPRRSTWGNVDVTPSVEPRYLWRIFFVGALNKLLAARPLFDVSLEREYNESISKATSSKASERAIVFPLSLPGGLPSPRVSKSNRSGACRGGGVLERE